MISSGPAQASETTQESEDFSLVLGGPLFQLFRRAFLSGDHLELLYRRIIAIPLIAWLPMLILSALQGRAWGSSVRVPFLLDIDVNARFLLTLPLFILAEAVVYQRMRPVVRQFLERGLIPNAAARAKFDAALASARHWRNSLLAEMLLIALVLLVEGKFARQVLGAPTVDTWYADVTNAGLRPTLAGWWYRGLSLPLFQFILLRWYYRMFIWARFLWQVARIDDLRLLPTHPDRVGGLGFLTGTVFAFVPLLLGQGVLFAATIASRIFFYGAKLPDFKVRIIWLGALAVFTVLGPLLVFSVRLDRAKRAGLREYGALAARYMEEFDQKWVRGSPPGDTLIGSADIQSWADMSNGFGVVREMRLVPFTLGTVWQLAVITLAPVAPLALTMIPLEDFLDQILKVLF
jgi:hypothetical protein